MRVIALFLSFLLVFNVFPFSAFATAVPDSDVPSHQSLPNINTEPDADDIVYENAPDVDLTQSDYEQIQDLDLVRVSESSNVYEDPASGQITEEIFSSPVRFQDSDGTLTDYDATLAESDETGYAYENTAGDAKNYFPDDIGTDTPIKLVKDDYEIGLTPETHDASAFEDAGSDITVEATEHTDSYGITENKPLVASYDAGDDIAIDYTSSDIGIKEDIVLDSIPATNTFSFELQLTGLIPQTTEGGKTVELYDSADATTAVAAIPEGMMQDSAATPVTSDDVTYTIEAKSSGTYRLNITVDANWLTDPQRVYPVTIDPSVYWRGTYADNERGLTTTFIRSGSSYAASTGNASQLPVGKGKEGTSRSYLKGDGFNGYVSGKTISSAVLHLRQVNNSSYNKSISIGVHRVLEPTGTQTNTYGSMTWNKRAPYASTPIATKSTGSTDYAHDITVTSWVAAVAHGTYTGYGLMLRQTDESLSKYTQFYGASAATESYRPKLTVTYTAPTAPTSVTVSPAATAGTALVKWAGISASDLDYVQVQIAYGTIAADGTHAASNTYRQTFATSPHVSKTLGTTGYSLNTAGWADGCYRIAIRGVDKGGVAGASTGAWIHVDRGKPSVAGCALTPAATGATWSRTLPVLSWTSASETPGCNYSWTRFELSVKRPDNTESAWRTLKEATGATSGAASHALNATEMPAGTEGAYDIRLRATDRVGNTQTVTLPYQFDQKAPTANFTVHSTDANTPSVNTALASTIPFTPLTVTNVLDVTIQLSDAGSGIATGTFSITRVGESVPRYTQAVTTGTNLYKLLGSLNISGLCELKLVATDCAGNASTKALTVNCTEALPAPRITPEYQAVSGETIHFDWLFYSAPDTLDHLQYRRCDGAGWTDVSTGGACTGGVDVPVPVNVAGVPIDGVYSYDFRGVDSHGVSGGVKTVTVTVSTVHPEARITGFHAGIVTAALSNAASYTVSFRPAGTVGYALGATQSFDHPANSDTIAYIDPALFLSSGSYTIRLEATAPSGLTTVDEIEVRKPLLTQTSALTGQISLGDSAGSIEVTSPDSALPLNVDVTAPLIAYRNGQFNGLVFTNNYSSSWADQTLWREDSWASIILTAPNTGSCSADRAQATSLLPPSLTESGYRLDGATWVNGAFLADIAGAAVTSKAINLAYPLRTFSLTAQSSPAGPAGAYCYVSFDGVDWHQVASGMSYEVSALDSTRLFTDTIYVKVQLKKGAHLTALALSGEVFKPDIVHVNLLAPFTPQNVSATDKINYSTYLRWTAVNKDLPADTTYEIVRATTPEVDVAHAQVLAEGLKDFYFTNPNTDYLTGYRYKLRAVRTWTDAGGTIHKSFGPGSEVVFSSALSATERAKRLGRADWLGYAEVSAVTAGNIAVEKSMGNVLVTTGDKTLESDSLLSEGMTRHYNSQSTATGPLGRGQDFAYNMELLSVESTDPAHPVRYFLKDDTGLIRAFDYNSTDQTWYTTDTKKVKLTVFDMPHAARLKTQRGDATHAPTYQTVLVKYVMERDKGFEYWFNQGGQLIYETSKIRQLDAGSTTVEVTPDATQANLTFEYDSDTGRLKTVTSKAARSLRFFYNAAGRITHVLYPDDSVVSYAYDEVDGYNIYLCEVRQHALKATNTLSDHPCFPADSSADICLHYGYTAADGVGLRLLNTLIDAEDNTTQITYSPVSTFTDLLYQADHITNPAGDQTSFTFPNPNGSAAGVSYLTRKPASATAPNYAERFTYDGVGQPIEEVVGSPEEVTLGTGQKTSWHYQDYLLETTTTQSEYHTLTAGVVSSTVTDKVATTTWDTESENALVATDEAGNATIATYDTDAEYVNADKPVHEETYDDAGDLTEEYDYAFDDEGNEIVEADITQEAVTESTYYTNGDLKEEYSYLQTYVDGVADPGRKVLESKSEYVYDADGNTTSETYTEYGQDTPVITRTLRSYDALGHVLTEQSGNLQAGVLTDSTETTNTYDVFGRLTSTCIREPGQAEKVTSSTYTPTGAIATETDERGITTAYTYDCLGRVTQTCVLALGYPDRITTTTYVSADVCINVPGTTRTITDADRTTSTDPAGLVTVSYHDAQGRVVRTVSAGSITDTTYTRDGKAYATITSAVGSDTTHKVTLSLYDSDGNVTDTVVNPTWVDGHYQVDEASICTHSSYDSTGKELSSTDASGNVTTYTYDEKGELASVTLPEALAVEAAGDCNPAHQTASPVSAMTAYINADLQTDGTLRDRSTDALGRVSQVTKDANGKTLAITDFGNASATGVGITTTYAYNAKGLTERETYTNGDYKTYAYDARGNLTQTEWHRADGTVELSSLNTYDLYGQLSSTTDHLGDNTAPVIYSAQNSYDIFGRVTSTFEGHGAPAASIPETACVRYTYDSADRITRIDYPAAAAGTATGDPVALSYAYNGKGQLADINAVYHAGNETATGILRHYAYDSFGKVNEIDDYPDFATGNTVDHIIRSYTYDALDRTTSMAYANSASPATPLESFAYTYDACDRITSERHISHWSADPAEQTDEMRSYTYDACGRLVRSVREDYQTAETHTTDYGFDAVGNRRLESTDGTTTVSLYNELNQLTASQTGADTETLTQYTYDANGNRVGEVSAGTVRTMTYDTDNRMSMLTENGTLINANVYRSNGQRIRKTGIDGTTDYYYQNGTVLYTTDTTQTTSFNLPGSSGNVIASCRYETSTTAAEWLLYHKDIRCSTTALTDANGAFVTGYRYSDYGETERIGDSATYNEIAYTGGIYDATTALYYLNARYYDPACGDFISQDTYRGENREPATLNYYGYCAGDPLNATDPSGHVKFHYGSGKGREPKYTFDNDFPFGSKAGEATASDYASWVIWGAKLAAAEAAGSLPDATNMYRHFRDATGTRRFVDYYRANDEDTYYWKKNQELIRIAQKKAESFAKKKAKKKKNFQMYSSLYKIANGNNENWQKTIGAHKVWASCYVSRYKKNFTMTITIAFRDMYNFNRGQQDLASNAPDDANGRFEELGWARSFETYGQMTKNVSWKKKKYSTTKIR
ncbi:MAG: DNRLRE domain-containing protein [Actinomycetes bacterium]|jgi:RHS repeat-associated protein|nr:DNRLRE domain-containing protein [Actinomycetes bacterium]